MKRVSALLIALTALPVTAAVSEPGSELPVWIESWQLLTPESEVAAAHKLSFMAQTDISLDDCRTWIEAGAPPLGFSEGQQVLSNPIMFSMLFKLDDSVVLCQKRGDRGSMIQLHLPRHTAEAARLIDAGAITSREQTAAPDAGIRQINSEGALAP